MKSGTDQEGPSELTAIADAVLAETTWKPDKLFLVESERVHCDDREW